MESDLEAEHPRDGGEESPKTPSRDKLKSQLAFLKRRSKSVWSIQAGGSLTKRTAQRKWATLDKVQQIQSEPKSTRRILEDTPKTLLMQDFDRFVTVRKLAASKLITRTRIWTQSTSKTTEPPFSTKTASNIRQPWLLDNNLTLKCPLSNRSTLNSMFRLQTKWVLPHQRKSIC